MRLSWFVYFLVWPMVVFSQNKGATQTYMLTKKHPLSAADSLKEKKYFLNALQEKTLLNTSQAVGLFEKVLKVNPHNDAALYELAIIKKSKKEEKDAQRYLEKAVSINPDNQWYWITLANTYQRTNNIAALENVYNHLIRIDPDKSDYYFDKADVLFLQERYAEALNVYKALELITGITDNLILSRQRIYIKQGNLDKGIADIQGLIATNPTELRYYIILADIYNSNKMADKAVSVLENASKMNQENGLLHLALADVYREKGDTVRSFTELEKAFGNPDVPVEQKIAIIASNYSKSTYKLSNENALKLSSILADAHLDNKKIQELHGSMLMYTGQNAAAIIFFERAIALSKDSYSTYEQLIKLLLSERDYDGVIRYGEEALSIFPKKAWLMYFVGTAYAQKKRFEKAIAYFNQTLSLDVKEHNAPLLGFLHASLGDSYHAVKNDKASDEAYEKSLEYDPNNVYTLNNYAYYLSLRGISLNKAANMSLKANELQPNNASFQDTYAWILFKQKKYGEAKVWMEKALSNNQNKSAVQTEHYGDILFHLGDINGALKNWEKAKQYGGNSSLLQRKINEKRYFE